MQQSPLRKTVRPSGAATTVVQVGPVRFGDGSYPVIAGPCSVEDEHQITEAARIVADGGGAMLRGGAYKPRTSPYSFQGLGRDGLLMLEAAGRAVGLPVVSEVLGAGDVEFVASHVDMLQIGSRNMQNFSLLRAVSHADKPVMLKRGLSSTIEEWLLAAEYILDGGNDRVVLCERGIRTFEPATRNTLDIAAVPVLRALTHLPVIVDPSHAAGRRDLIAPLALAARAVGADGMMVEVHPDPASALSDGPQQLDAAAFGGLMEALEIGSRRDTIDRIDAEIIRLLGLRIDVALKIGHAKAVRGLDMHVPGRERQLISTLTEHARRHNVDPDMISSIYETILRSSVAAQRSAFEADRR